MCLVGREDEEEELGTEYLIKSREQNRAVKEENDSQTDEAEIGTEFLIKNNVNLSPKELSVPLRSSRRRSTVTNNDKSTVSVDESSQGDESGPNRQITDIAADAMSLQPTGYTLETAHVSCVILKTSLCSMESFHLMMLVKIIQLVVQQFSYV